MSQVLQWMQLEMIAIRSASTRSTTYLVVKKKEGRDSLLGIDLEPHTKVLSVILHILVYARGTEPVLHTLVLWPLHLRMFVPILDLQMYWLIFLVIRSRP